MSENSAIEWCDHTFNPWWGCSKVSPACDHCYPEKVAARFRPEAAEWAVNGARSTQSAPYWDKPVAWDRLAENAGTPAMVFCASMCDVFEEHDALEAPRRRLWNLIERTPHLIWLLLTKRPKNMNAMTPPSWTSWPANAWAGCTVENGEVATMRLHALSRVPAPVRFVSCEPLLGPVPLREWLREECSQCGQPRASWQQAGDARCRYHAAPEPECDGRLERTVDWVIAGGESGPDARPTHPAWVRSLASQCLGAIGGVPFFFKQWGAWKPAPACDPMDQAERAILFDVAGVRGLRAAWGGRPRSQMDANGAGRQAGRGTGARRPRVERVSRRSGMNGGFGLNRVPLRREFKIL